MVFTTVYAALANLGPGCSQQIFFGLGVGLMVPAGVNVLAFFAVGVPAGAALAFGCSQGVTGLWGGLIIGMALLLLGQYAFLAAAIDWKDAARVAQRKAQVRAAMAGSELAHSSTAGSEARRLRLVEPDAVAEPDALASSEVERDGKQPSPVHAKPLLGRMSDVCA